MQKLPAISIVILKLEVDKRGSKSCAMPARDLRSGQMFMKPMRHCTSVVNAVSLLIGTMKKTWLISCFLNR